MREVKADFITVHVYGKGKTVSKDFQPPFQRFERGIKVSDRHISSRRQRRMVHWRLRLLRNFRPLSRKLYHERENQNRYYRAQRSGDAFPDTGISLLLFSVAVKVYGLVIVRFFAGIVPRFRRARSEIQHGLHFLYALKTSLCFEGESFF